MSCLCPSLVSFVIPQPPKAKKAPSFIRGRVVNESRDDMRRWSDAASHFVPEELIKYKGPLDVKINAVFRRPNAHYKRNLRGDDARLKAGAPRCHVVKPDGDNLAKFVGDCLSGLAFHDDSQITHLKVTKHWSHTKAFTKVRLKYLAKPNVSLQNPKPKSQDRLPTDTSANPKAFIDENAVAVQYLRQTVPNIPFFGSG